VLPERIETLSAGSEFTESFDVVGCRALGPDTVPYELAAPLLCRGGSLLMWRTGSARDGGPAVGFRVLRSVDLGQFSARLMLTRYDSAASESLYVA